MTRRADGALEQEVLDTLWTAARALTPAEVRAKLAADLAYTTVMTVLGRLHDKGVVTRTTRGRAYAYAARFTEAELTAKRMSDVLAAAHDRAGAAQRFRRQPVEARCGAAAPSDGRDWPMMSLLLVLPSALAAITGVIATAGHRRMHPSWAARLLVVAIAAVGLAVVPAVVGVAVAYLAHLPVLDGALAWCRHAIGCSRADPRMAGVDGGRRVGCRCGPARAGSPLLAAVPLGVPR